MKLPHFPVGNQPYRVCFDGANICTSNSIPTVANGYVYLGTESDNVNTIGQGTFYIFGPNRTCN